MKKLKLLSLVLIFVLCFLLTGCGNEKVLSCSQTEEDSGLIMTQKVDMTFKDDKLTNVKMTINTEASDDDIKDNWSYFVSVLDGQFQETNTNGIKLTKNNNEDDYTYTVVLDADLKAASEEDLVNYDLDSLVDSDETYDSLKEQAEEDGFTCK